MKSVATNQVPVAPTLGLHHLNKRAFFPSKSDAVVPQNRSDLGQATSFKINIPTPRNLPEMGIEEEGEKAEQLGRC